MVRKSEPAILTRLIGQLISKGHSPESARRIAFKSLQASGNLEPGSMKATDKGRLRGLMTPGERAIDREASRSGNSASSYKYSVNTNRATLKGSKKRKRKGALPRLNMGGIDKGFKGF